MKKKEKPAKAQDAIDTVKKFDFNGRTVALIPIDRIRPNPWNPNVMDAEMMEKEKASITEYGMIVPILVRQVGVNIWEIIDGEHRYETCKLLGHKEILCVDLGLMSDQKAKKLTIIANDLRGQSDPNKLNQLVEDLAKNESIEDLAKLLPQSQAELESMIAALKPYDLESLAGPMSDADSPDPMAPSLAGLGKEMRVQIGPIKGSVSESVFRSLMEEYTNSAQHLGTKNLELVVADLAQRLQDVRREVQASEPAKKERPAKGA